ncbi:MAG: serpin family protein, partial [Oscillospiraceae bacterium]
MRKIKSIVALILCISALAACTPKTSFVLPEEDPVMTIEQPVAPMPPVDTEPDVTEPVVTEPAEPSVKPISATEQKNDYSDYTAADSVNRLGFMLYDKLQSEDNVFFSPYSIDIALSMLENGANGNTKTELDELLSLSDSEKRNSEFSAIMNSFTDKKAVLQTANSIWVDKDFQKRTPVKEDFISVLQKYYEAEAEYADFKSPKTVDKVNSWISKKTNKMIPKMLNELDDETVMLLINAVYFEGKWSTPFEKDNTTDWKFAGTKGETTVDMMRMYGKSY